MQHYVRLQGSTPLMAKLPCKQPAEFHDDDETRVRLSKTTFEPNAERL